jgi:shikimate dehydrogenase
MPDISLKQFGLLGRNISYSFSKGYFTKKFTEENLTNCSYDNFDIPEITDFPDIIIKNPDLIGMNVTIPYKEVVIPYLDELSEKAASIGAVNTIKFSKDGKSKGYNTDYFGFTESLKPLLQEHHKKALILGTGGASKGVAYALKELNIDSLFVSRSEKENVLSYDQINENTFAEYQIIINCSPVGTSPNIEAYPLIPYEYFTHKHIAYDLIYNPEETQFLKKAKTQGAQTKNGLDMLVFQAEKSWEIWNK